MQRRGPLEAMCGWGIYHTAIKNKLTGDETLVTNIRHQEALRKTQEALFRVLGGMDLITSYFLAMDIK